MTEARASLCAVIHRGWWGVFGKPDGHLIRLRCWLLGHAWRTCWDDCCEGGVNWCARCLTRVIVVRSDGRR